jgi:hypothetical protein
MRPADQLVERSFALVLDRGGMRRAWLRGRANLNKRYRLHVAGYNFGLIMRPLLPADGGQSTIGFGVTRTSPQHCLRTRPVGIPTAQSTA